MPHANQTHSLTRVGTLASVIDNFYLGVVKFQGEVGSVYFQQSVGSNHRLSSLIVGGH